MVGNFLAEQLVTKISSYLLNDYLVQEFGRGEWGGGVLSTMESALQGSIPGIPEIFSDKIFNEKVVDVAKDNQRPC